MVGPVSRQRRISELQESLGDDPPVTFMLQREMLDPYVLAYFSIQGEPQSKARARWTGTKGGTPAYSPKANKEAEAKIAWLFRQAAGPWQPNSDSNYGLFAAFYAKTRQRRDVDNMIKLLCDGLNGVAWVDDRQVSEVSGKVIHNSDDPRTEVIIYETLTQPRQTVPCKNCGQPYLYYESQKESRQYRSLACGREYRRTHLGRVCAGCGERFTTKPSGGQKYCSDECRERVEIQELTCATCGKVFRRPRSKNRAGVPTCSVPCRVEHQRRQRKIGDAGTCDACGGPTTKKTYARCRECVKSGRYPDHVEAAPKIAEARRQRAADIANPDAAEIRRWARENGWPNLGHRGRLPKPAVAAYRERAS